eukprot:TRINITY_DN10006_c0_g1_i1.p1 TRINITY_DN10006_c0_g1~~TRINITY_DN10006_c0_g1_i1.p1  ORF type:complete len:610 (+),score=97.64 TRINITY_DN10006_c0_g1_i1:45-1874(+)
MEHFTSPRKAHVVSLPLSGGGSRPKVASNRHVDIQLVGLPRVGKTPLLETLLKDVAPMQLPKFNEQRANLMTHHTIEGGEKILKLLDCSGNMRAAHLVKDWFGCSRFVVVVYDVANKASLDHAFALGREVNKADARVVMFGNKWNVKSGQPTQVDPTLAENFATQHNGMALESSMLIDAVRLITDAITREEQAEATEDVAHEFDLDDLAQDCTRKGSGSASIDSVKSVLNRGVLRPSLRGTEVLKDLGHNNHLNAGLRPVQELQESQSAVTCVCFGQEHLHRAYILLVTASKDGKATVYRCYRTEMEIAMLLDEEFPHDQRGIYDSPPGDDTNVVVHSRLVGHSRAITSIFFNLFEDQLVTTSIDKSIRVWHVDTGRILRVLQQGAPVAVAALLPFSPHGFVAASSDALTLVHVQSGEMLQYLRVDARVRALKFDDTGLFLLAGTKNGSIHVLEASDSTTLKFNFKVHVSRGGVTCITFVAANYGQPPCLLVNTSDSSASIIDCTYGPPAGVLTNLTVRQRVHVSHSMLPLRCCYSPSDRGFLISGSEDNKVHIVSLAKGLNYRAQCMKHHEAPVVVVSVNLQDTLLASADCLGRLVLWRRMDLLHGLH